MQHLGLYLDLFLDLARHDRLYHRLCHHGHLFAGHVRRGHLGIHFVDRAAAL